MVVYDHLILLEKVFNASSAKISDWSNTLKQVIGNLPTNCLSVFDHFVGLTLKWLRFISKVKNDFYHASMRNLT